MYIKEIILKNFGKFSKVKANFNENITYLIGPNGAGKTTLGLTGLWAIMKGIATKSPTPNILKGERFRFINDEGATAQGVVILHDEKKGYDIKVTRTISKDSTTLKFEAPTNEVLDQKWLDDLFNVFLIAPNEFADLSSKEQAIALGIDTSNFDEELNAVKGDYTVINRMIKAFGDLKPLEDIKEPIDIIPVKNNLNSSKQVYEAYKLKSEAYALNSYKKSEIERKIENLKKELAQEEKELEGIKTAIVELNYNEEDEQTLLKHYQQCSARYEEVLNYNASIQEFETLRVKHQDKAKLEEDLKNNKEKQSEILQRREEHIKSFKLPFNNLSINDQGELLLNDKPIKEPYFSTGELLRIIPILMSHTNPELKYVFIQKFDLLDEENQKKVIEKLSEKGFQLVIEHVGKQVFKDKNCILLDEMKIINQPEIIFDDNEEVL